MTDGITMNFGMGQGNRVVAPSGPHPDAIDAGQSATTREGARPLPTGTGLSPAQESAELAGGAGPVPTLDAGEGATSEAASDERPVPEPLETLGRAAPAAGPVPTDASAAAFVETAGVGALPTPLPLDQLRATATPKRAAATTPRTRKAASPKKATVKKAGRRGAKRVRGRKPRAKK